MRAEFEENTKMMIINEFKIFGDYYDINELKFKNDPDCYVIPISMEIFHEMLGHAMLRYNNEVDCSPLVIRDSKNDFKAQKVMKRIKFDENNEKEVNKGETERVLEHYISEDQRVIQMLKEKTFNKKNIDTKYWIGNNFDSLHKELEFNVNKEGISNFQDYIIMFDDYNNEEYCDCILHD